MTYDDDEHFGNAEQLPDSTPAWRIYSGLHVQRLLICGWRFEATDTGEIMATRNDDKTTIVGPTLAAVVEEIERR